VQAFFAIYDKKRQKKHYHRREKNLSSSVALRENQSEALSQVLGASYRLMTYMALKWQF
jgi:hypothetical protein